jgi:hypothetical protein
MGQYFLESLCSKTHELHSFACARRRDAWEPRATTQWADEAAVLDRTETRKACRETLALSSLSYLFSAEGCDEFHGKAATSMDLVMSVLAEAQRVWGPDKVYDRIQCLVSIDTSMQGCKVDVTRAEEKLQNLYHDTFNRSSSVRYHRIDASQWLKNIRPIDIDKWNDIEAAVRQYSASQEKKIKACFESFAETDCE